MAATAFPPCRSRRTAGERNRCRFSRRPRPWTELRLPRQSAKKQKCETTWTNCSLAGFFLLEPTEVTEGHVYLVMARVFTPPTSEFVSKKNPFGTCVKLPS